MANLKSLNPDAARKLDTLRTELRQQDVNRKLAANVLHTTATQHKVATLEARERHTRRPRVTLV